MISFLLIVFSGRRLTDGDLSRKYTSVSEALHFLKWEFTIFLYYYFQDIPYHISCDLLEVDGAVVSQVVRVIVMGESRSLNWSRCGVLAVLSLAANSGVQYFDWLWLSITMNSVEDAIGNVN